MAPRREMQLGDWYHAAVNFVIGVFVGEAMHGLSKLFVSGAWGYIWILALLVASLAVVLILTELLFALADRFVYGIERSGQREPVNRRPLARVISLPTGLGAGMILAELGLSATGLLSL